MDRNIKLIALHNFFTDLKFYSAVLVIYFADVTGSYALAMSLFSVAYLSSAAFEIPTGIYSDRVGRKTTLILGSVTAFLSAVFYAAGSHYAVLLTGALFEGISRAFYSGNNSALLYDSVAEAGRKKEYADILGKTRSLFQVALAIGAVAGSIGAAKSFALIMWASAVPQFLCILVSIGIKEPVKKSAAEQNIFAHLKSSLKLLLTHRRLRLISLQDILSFGINEATFHFRAAFIVTVWPLWAVGVSKFLSYAGATVSFWFSGKTIRRWGEIPSLLFARTYGRIIGFISYGFPTVVSPLLLASTSAFYGTVTVASDSFTQRFLTQRERATVPSLTSFFGSIFIGFFSVLLGFVADITNPGTALLCAEVLSSIVLLVIWRLYGISKQKGTIPTT